MEHSSGMPPNYMPIGPLCCRFGMLATQGRGELEGFPSGSVVEYAADAQVCWAGLSPAAGQGGA